MPEISLGDVIDNQEMITRTDALDDIDNDDNESDSDGGDVED